jgi:5-hydroxyisourate hydrolase
MAKLTTHVLDVYSGKPGKGIKVELFFFNGENKEKINSIILNNDGRSDQPLAEQERFKLGKYELVFYIGNYFNKITKNTKLPFLDDVIIRFGISDNTDNYHVPLLVSPWSYSTYKGS